MTVKNTQLTATGGTAGNGNSNVFAGDVSSGGGLVVFDSTATNLAAGGGNDSLYLWSAQSGVRFLDGIDPAHGSGSTFDGAISSDGKFVTFVGAEGYQEFILVHHNGLPDTETTLFSTTYDEVFVENLATGVLTDISQAGHSLSVQLDPNSSSGPPRPGDSLHPSISSDGSHIAFDSVAPDLLPAGSAGNTLSQIYVWDASTNQDILVSAVNGVAGTGAPPTSMRPAWQLPAVDLRRRQLDRLRERRAKSARRRGGLSRSTIGTAPANGSTTLTNLGGGELPSISARTAAWSPSMTRSTRRPRAHLRRGDHGRQCAPRLPAFTARPSSTSTRPGDTQIVSNGDSSSASLSANGRLRGVPEHVHQSGGRRHRCAHSQDLCARISLQTITSLASVEPTSGLGGNGDSACQSVDFAGRLDRHLRDQGQQSQPGERLDRRHHIPGGDGRRI